MQRSVKMMHLLSKAEKNAYMGFSWSYLFLGCFEALRRGEKEVAILHALLTVFTVGIWQVVHAFFYNRMHAQRLLDKGYVISDNAELTRKARQEWHLQHRSVQSESRS